MFHLGKSLRFMFLAAGFVVTLLAAGCASSCECSIVTPHVNPTSASGTFNVAQGTQNLPTVNGFSSSVNFSSVTPSATTANVTTSEAAPSQVPSMASSCTPSAITNPFLYVTFSTAATVNVTVSDLVLTLPSGISTAHTFYAEVDDLTNPSHQCASQGTVSGQTVTFSGGNATLTAGDQFEIVFFFT